MSQPPPDSEQSSRDLAQRMHDLSVHLWNALWREAGENTEFPQRSRVERVQLDLSILGWPEASRPYDKQEV